MKSTLLILSLLVGNQILASEVSCFRAFRNPACKTAFGPGTISYTLTISDRERAVLLKTVRPCYPTLEAPEVIPQLLQELDVYKDPQAEQGTVTFRDHETQGQLFRLIVDQASGQASFYSTNLQLGMACRL